MKKIVKRIFMALTSFVFVLLTAVVGLFPSTVFGIAETNNVTAYESQNVLDDLENATINGETFSLKKYGFNVNKETQVLSFTEYCYSFYSDKQNDYGLYVYVYNPQGLKFDTESNLNQIQLVYGESTNTHYTKYPLRFLNCSTETTYERLFYKFKIELTSEQRSEILSTVNSTERVYRVSGIELLTKGQTNATDYTVATTYKFSGYAAGYGSDENAASTLACAAEENDVLSLAVHATQYRPEGTNGKNEYTQDSLHSVYFAVPNEYIEKYGEMSAVHATWLNAVLKPALVTGNWEAYKAIRAFLGVDTDSITCKTGIQPGDGIGGGGGGARSTDVNVIVGNLDYGYIGAYETHARSDVLYHKGDMAYLPRGFFMPDVEQYERELSALYMLFYSGSGEDSADNYTVQSEVLAEKLKESAWDYGGTRINGKYAACIFESVDSEFTDVNIRRSDTYSLTSEKITQNWWQKLWGTGTTVSNKFDGINAIYPVKASDVSGANKEISERLYISESDCDKFKSFYNANKDLCTVYLFRYQVSDYFAQEATLFETKTSLGVTGWVEKDTNAYFFQETVNLDFDIIDVTFSNGEKDTVIPVVSDPIDVIPAVTPPVTTTSDKDPEWWEWVKKVLLLILAVVLFIVLMPILSTIFSILLLPFKLIIKLIKKLFHRKE